MNNKQKILFSTEDFVVSSLLRRSRIFHGVRIKDERLQNGLNRNSYPSYELGVYKFARSLEEIQATRGFDLRRAIDGQI